MTPHRDRQPALAWLELQPGLAMAWPLEGGAVDPPDEAGAESPRACRAAALRKAWAAAGKRELWHEAPELREITLLDSETLDAGALARALDALRQLPGAPLVRLARHGAEDSATIVALGEGAARIEPPPVLHLILSGGAPLNGAWERTLAALADRGWPLAAEIWVEREDGLETDSLRDLLRRLIGLRVRPYFLVDGEWLPMARRLAEADCLALVRNLRGWISGLAVPQLVREDKRGRRELIVPHYIESLEPDRVTLRSFSGRLHEYINPGGEPR